MESSNLHELQQEPVWFAPLATQSGYGVVSTIQDWNPKLTMKKNDYITYMNEIFPHSRELWQRNSNPVPSCETRSFSSIESANKLQVGKIEENMLDCFSKYNDMNVQTIGQHISPTDQLYNSYSFSHFPSSNSGNMNLSSSIGSSSSLGLNFVMDLQSLKNHGEICSQPLSSDYMQESSDSQSSSSLKTSPFRNGAAITKRISCSTEHKPSNEAAKKPRLTSHSSSPQPKVRKENSRDRIAALHRLVSPFGKTDTASVLTEAIGYIHFLQAQIQTLSVPYMKSYHGKPYRRTQSSSIMEDKKEVELMQDLKSRGLCLVPLSFTSYINYSNGGIS